MIRTVQATRYVAALREDGSMPGLVEGNDDGMYVLKFRGAGQGPGVLISELIAGEVARALGLKVPEIVFLEVDAALGRNEPDYEIRNLIQGSLGLNLGLDYLPGSLAWDPAASKPPDALSSSSIVWLDAFVTERTRVTLTYTPGASRFVGGHPARWQSGERGMQAKTPSTSTR